MEAQPRNKEYGIFGAIISMTGTLGRKMMESPRSPLEKVHVKVLQLNVHRVEQAHAT